MTTAWISGWLATAAIVLAVLVPVGQRIRAGKRGAPGSAPIRLHVVIGVVAAALGFAHTMTILPALGSPAAVAGGFLALAPGGAAFFILFAHAGVGLQLRDPRLKGRVEKRRLHVTTATLIAVSVLAHIVLLERAPH